MPEILPDDVQALRDALETSPDDVTVTLSLTRKSAEKVLELLEAEHSTGAVVVPVKDLFTSTEAATMLGMSRPTVVPPESWRVRLCGFPGGDRCAGLIVDGTEHSDGGVSAVVIVEPGAPVQHDGPGLVDGSEVVPGEDFPLQGGEERLRGCVVEA